MYEHICFIIYEYTYDEYICFIISVYKHICLYISAIHILFFTKL